MSQAAEPVPRPTLLDMDTEAFMRVAETWPRTRISILAQGRHILQDRFHRNGSRTVASLENWFGDIQEVGSGFFGTVCTACIREWDADDVPSEGTCVAVRVPIISAQPHILRLVIKLTKGETADVRQDRPFAAHDCAYKHWQGSRNPIREAAMGRLLNSLVICNATPNLPLIYEPFSTMQIPVSMDERTPRTRSPVMPALRLPAFLTAAKSASAASALALASASPSPVAAVNRQSPTASASSRRAPSRVLTRGFAMELCSIRFRDYLIHVSASPLSRHDMFKRLDSAVLQVCHGLLCAQKHFDFRHNDLHAENVMATFITDTTYNYLVHGRVFPIQNFGMCWKIIDFGFSACAAFGEHDVAEALFHSIAPLRVSHVGPCAAEVLDLLHLLQSARAVSGDAVQDRLDVHIDILREVSRASDQSGSLQAVIQQSQHNRHSMTQPTSAVCTAARSSGVLEQFFVTLASRKDGPTETEPSSGPVFDADNSPFPHGGSSIVVYDDVRILGHSRTPYAAYDVDDGPRKKRRASSSSSHKQRFV